LKLRIFKNLKIKQQLIEKRNKERGKMTENKSKVKGMRLAMVVGISKALEYKAKNPKAELEEVLQFVMKSINAQEESKVAAIAAASRAIKYREQNPQEKGKIIMQRVMNETDLIVNEIEKSN